MGPVASGPMPRRKHPDALALEVGQRIRALREEAGITQEQLAFTSELGSKGHLSSLEKGLVMPTVATLKALADRLGVLVADLVNDPGEGDRAKLLELTRSLPAGVVRKLVRELTALKSKK
jgi:transcriptional regulator with XRE-family HTH domain